ncbi:unnamed protein product [Rotaria sordida]|uniref:PX domain-containing protein n=1 Tax=Rotaria sordida TaxID=392033 RepID=A0A819J147_9BILA|nr:unnamed protein product [Rotaria sordida]CAF1047111.1 unnamed protein product [Rotaria sordida]CAF3926747.1 unnamed protein product [Rotaria sordida]
MPVDLSTGSIPPIYRNLFEMINLHGIDKLTLAVFVPLFESNTLTQTILNQIWTAVIKTNSISSRNDFYKCLALMALVQQGKNVDEKLLDNYVNRELPIPTLDALNELEDRLIRILRSDQGKTTLCFRYGDLCSLDTIQVNVAPEKKGVIIRHFEYEVTSMHYKNKVSRRYNDFVALHELLSLKYPFRIIPQLPPKKTVNVDKEFIEERRRSLKRYLQILCRHPTICEIEIIKFFLTFQGTSCGDNMKATFKNTLDEFSCEPPTSSSSIDRIERHEEDSTGIRMFRISETHISFLYQQFSQIRTYLKNINERNFKTADEYLAIEKSLQLISSDSTRIERWATGLNDYWPTIQGGLATLPFEINAVAERINEECRYADEVINDHLDMLIELLQGYKDLCKRFEEALQIEQRAIQKATNQNKRSLTTNEVSTKNDNLNSIEKRNNHALKCIQTETQLIYANLEAFVYILSSLGNIQSKISSDLLDIWKSFSNKISELGQTYVNKSSIQRTNTIGLKNK